MELKIIHCSANGAGLLKAMTERVLAFCEKYDSDAVPEVMYESLAQNYFDSAPSILMFAVVDNGEIVSHAVYTTENFYGHRYINMLQYWVDDGVKVPYDIKEQTFREVAVWGAAVGIDEVKIFARNEEVAERFGNVYGFEKTPITIMKSSLTGVADRIAERSNPGVTEE